MVVATALKKIALANTPVPTAQSVARDIVCVAKPNMFNPAILTSVGMLAACGSGGGGGTGSGAARCRRRERVCR